MRIAIVTENFLPKLDGVTRTLATMLEHFQRCGHKAIVLGPEGAPHRYAGARVYAARGVPLPMYPEIRALFPSRRLEHRLAHFRPDVVHVVDPILLGSAGIFWARRLHAPIVASYHTNLAAYCDYFRLGWLTAPAWAYRRWLHNHCAVTLAPSFSTIIQLEQQGFQHLRVWRRGVDSALFSPERRSRVWRSLISGDPDTPIALYVGRLSWEKNLGALVSAFIARRYRNARLVLVGDGPARPELETMLAQQPVTFTGYLTGVELAEAYASSDLFVFPSTTETFGQVVLEAMASGLPVAAYDAEGVRDNVIHGTTGMLSAPTSTTGLHEAIDALLAHPYERARMGRNAREYARQYTWDTVMQMLEDTYEEIIDGHRAVHRTDSVSTATFTKSSHHTRRA
ncbi:MAG: hypothetical protein OJF49_000339 [Ktedonobacterales bacterium]|jgi:glycosyltransferase involved in cell wall biosynthesis|nr:MAG: hypothetical protein OJF49_000339 [Ktedonobacterales bacterium]